MAGILAPSGKNHAASQNIAQGLRIQSSIQAKPVAVVFGTNRVGGNLIWYGAFTAYTASKPSQSGGKGGVAGGGGGKGGGSGSQQTTYTASVAIGLCEGPIDGVGMVWANTSNFPDPGTAGFTIFNGGYSQTPWSYLTTNFPANARNYHGFAYAAYPNYNLGGNPQLPQHSFEIQGLNRYNPGGGIVDANPKDIITTLLTNANFGAVPSISLADMTQYSNYCVALGLFLSPVYDSQQTFATIIQDLLSVTNSTCVWSAPGTLTIIPYGDKAATGNGVTFTPQLTPQYDLTDDDFFVDEKQPGPPVTATRSDTADAYNQLSLECVDRANNYNVAMVEWKDQGAIDYYGFKPSPNVVSTKGAVTTPAVGAVVAQLIGRRQLYIRNTFSFRLPIRFSRLEAGDLVTLTTGGRLNLSRQLVRLTNVNYGSSTDEVIVCTAEEVPVGVAAPAAYGSLSTSGYAANFNAAPGNIATPTIFDAPSQLTTSGYEIWAAAASVGPNWGGCEVWASFDNSTFEFQGMLYGPSRYGTVTTTSFPAGSDPDTTNSVAVDLTISGGTLGTGTQTDADNHNTLCLVNNEVLAYQTATLNAANKYTLGTYLRRGIFNTVEGAVAGNRFVRLDEGLLRIPYSPSLVGKTIYLKFPSINKWGAALQSLSSISSYSYVIQGPMGVPGNVTGFSGAVQTLGIALSWNAVAGAQLYEVRLDTNFGTGGAVYIGKVQSFTDIPRVAGSYTYYVKAIDIAGRYSTTAASTTVVVNTPPAPGSFMAAVAATDAVLSFTAPTTQYAIDTYEIRTGTSWVGGALLAQPKTTTFKTPINWTGSKTFWLAVRDISGQYGTPVSTSLVINTAPAPTVTGMLVNLNYNIGWNEVVGSLPTTSYEVSWGSSPGQNVLGTVKGTTAFQQVAQWLGQRTFYVRAISTDGAGNTYFGAAGSISITVNAPNAVAVVPTIIDNQVMLSWSDATNSLPIDHYEVRSGSVFATATVIAPQQSTRFLMRMENQQGTYTYWVFGVDTAGNAGPAVSASATVAKPPDYLLYQSYDSELDQTTNTNWLRTRGIDDVLSFPGSSSVYASHAAPMAALDSGVVALSVGVWASTTSLAQNGGVIEKTDASGNTNTCFLIFFEGSNIKARVIIGGVNFDAIYPTSKLVSGQFYYFQLRWDPLNGLSLNVNGQLQASTSMQESNSVDAGKATFRRPGRVPLIVTGGAQQGGSGAGVLQQGAGPLYIGKLASGTYNFNGKVGPVRIYTRRITDQECFEHYSGIFKNNASLVAAWDMSEGDNPAAVAGVVHDDSGDYYDLTLNGGVTFVASNLDGRYDSTLGNPQAYFPYFAQESILDYSTRTGYFAAQDAITGGYNYPALPAPLSAQYFETYDYGATIPATSITATLTSAPFLGSVTITPTISVKLNATDPWTDYVGLWNVFVNNFRYVKITLNVTSAGGNNEQIATRLNTRLDVKKKTDAGNATANAGDVGGTTVNFNQTFARVDGITITPQTTNATYSVVSYVYSTLNPTSFKVLLFDTTGTRVTLPFGWTAIGA